MKPPPHLTIIRPGNCVFIGITVLFGALYKQELSLGWALMAGVLSAMTIGAAGYVINDCFDYPIDRINRPNRVLPAGRMTVRGAFLYAIFLFLIGLYLSLWTHSLIVLCIATVNTFLLYFYARVFKRRFLIGHLVVAWLAGSTFLFGGYIVGNPANSLLVAGYAFVFTLMREIVKTLEDLKGDTEAGVASIPVKYGVRTAIRASFFLAVIMFLFSGWALIAGLLTRWTFVILLVGIHLPLFSLHRYLLLKPVKSAFSHASGLMKIGMLILLAILWISG